MLEGLLRHLSTSQAGYSLAGNTINALAYADDICVAAASKVEVQDQLDRCVAFSDWAGFRFNAPALQVPPSQSFPDQPGARSWTPLCGASSSRDLNSLAEPVPSTCTCLRPLGALGIPSAEDEAHVARAAQAFKFLGDTRDPVIRWVALHQLAETVSKRASRLDPTNHEDLAEFLKLLEHAT